MFNSNEEKMRNSNNNKRKYIEKKINKIYFLFKLSFIYTTYKIINYKYYKHKILYYENGNILYDGEWFGGKKNGKGFYIMKMEILNIMVLGLMIDFMDLGFCLGKMEILNIMEHGSMTNIMERDYHFMKMVILIIMELISKERKMDME